MDAEGRLEALECNPTFALHSGGWHQVSWMRNAFWALLQCMCHLKRGRLPCVMCDVHKDCDVLACCRLTRTSH
eukprot:5170347-Amphidinium_carterae.1